MVALHPGRDLARVRGLLLLLPGPGHQRFFLPVFFHDLALRANVARRRVFGFFDFFIARSLLTGIFFPFFALADFRSFPRLAFLILMPLLRRRRATTESYPAEPRNTDTVRGGRPLPGLRKREAPARGVERALLRGWAAGAGSGSDYARSEALSGAWVLPSSSRSSSFGSHQGGSSRL